MIAMIPLFEQLKSLTDAQELLLMLAGDCSDEEAAREFARAGELTQRAHHAVIDDIIYRIAAKEPGRERGGVLPPTDQDVAKLLREAQAVLKTLSYTPYRQMIAEAQALLEEGSAAVSAYSRNRPRMLAEIMRAGRLASIYLLSAQHKQLEKLS